MKQLLARLVGRKQPPVAAPFLNDAVLTAIAKANPYAAASLAAAGRRGRDVASAPLAKAGKAARDAGAVWLDKTLQLRFIRAMRELSTILRTHANDPSKLRRVARRLGYRAAGASNVFDPADAPTLKLVKATPGSTRSVDVIVGQPDSALAVMHETFSDGGVEREVAVGFGQAVPPQFMGQGPPFRLGALIMDAWSLVFQPGQPPMRQRTSTANALLTRRAVLPTRDEYARLTRWRLFG